MRLPDWEARLAGLLDRVRDLPFALGRWDCALFAGAAVEAVTGVDIAAPFRGRYSTVRGYMRALHREGHKDLFGPFDAIAPRTGALLCGRGDIVTDGAAVGVMWTGGALFVGMEAEGVAERHGLLLRPASVLVSGWKIG